MSLANLWKFGDASIDTNNELWIGCGGAMYFSDIFIAKI